MTTSALVLGVWACLCGPGWPDKDPPKNPAGLAGSIRPAPEEAYAVPKRVRRIGASATSGTATATSITITIPAGGVPAGRRLIASLTTGSPSGAVTASDSRGNTWSLDADRPDAALFVRAVILSAHVTTALDGGHTVTVQFPGITNAALVLDEYAGIASTGAVGQKGANSGTGAAVSAGPVTTTKKDELLVGHIASRGNADAVNFTPGSGWTVEPGIRAGQRWALPEYRNAVSPGAYQLEGALGVSTGWVAVVVAYKPAAQIPLPSDDVLAGDDPQRRNPDEPSPTTVRTATDLALSVGQQNAGQLDWVSETKILAPKSLGFRWTRPAIRGSTETSPRTSLTEKAQWQMFSGASATGTVMFLPVTQSGPSGLGPNLLHSYGGVPVAPAGSTADFTIPAEKVPAKPGAVLWVRVVLSSPNQLRASPWVKISVPVITVPFPDPVAVSITLTDIECVRETRDLSPEDEIYVVVAAVDLTRAGGGSGVYVRASRVYDFDEHDQAMRVRSPMLRVWGPYGSNVPMPIIAPDAAVILTQVVEHDGDYSPGTWTSVIAARLINKLDEGLDKQLPHATIIEQLDKELFTSVMTILAKPTDSDVVGVAFVNTRESAWRFAADELNRARQGEVVKREFSFKGALEDDVAIGGPLGDDSWYKVRFEISRAGTTASTR